MSNKTNQTKLKQPTPMLILGSRAVDYLESRRGRDEASTAVVICLVMFLVPLLLMAGMLICFLADKKTDATTGVPTKEAQR